MIMVRIGILGSLEVGVSEVGGMQVRAVCGQEGSWREELYKRFTREFLVDVAERVGRKGGKRVRGRWRECRGRWWGYGNRYIR